MCRDSMPAAKRGAGGFTFLELIVVLSILAVLTAIIVPVFGNSVSALKRRSARGDFVAQVYFVQELAVRESREMRLYIDTRKGAYWIEGWVEGHGDDKAFSTLSDQSQGACATSPNRPISPESVRVWIARGMFTTLRSYPRVPAIRRLCRLPMERVGKEVPPSPPRASSVGWRSRVESRPWLYSSGDVDRHGCA